MATTERYIVDAQGNRVAVVIDMDDYKRLLEELGELRERDEMRRYDPTRDPDAGLKVRDDVRAELLQAQADSVDPNFKGAARLAPRFPEYSHRVAPRRGG
ncbi:MAG TPA: hypothetical protein VJ793_10235 [Anaerolineae bacterium]|nr:hypothetical protein [Anaerolineae bacterium]